MSTVRITKDLALQITSDVFKPSKKELKLRIEKHNETLYDMYLKQLPKAAKEYIIECPSHQVESTYVSITDSEGVPELRHRLNFTDTPVLNLIETNNLPCKRFKVLQSYAFSRLVISILEKEDKRIVKESARETENYRTNLQKKAEEMYNTLLQLKTKKKVLEIFPELEKFFPKEQIQTPAIINYAIKDFITNQPI